jgi:DNA-binding LacI/PurR family transcriptional regulator
MSGDAVAQPTIYDLFARADASIAAVARVPNTPDQVTPHTCARVVALSDTLGFASKREALVRARKGVGRISVLTPSFSAGSFAERLRRVVGSLAGTPCNLSNSPCRLR